MAQQADTQLSLHGLSTRVHAERTKQARLLERIARKRAELARLREGEHDARAEAARAAPLVEEAVELARAISQAFAEMLADPKRSKTQRKKIAEVHRLLVEIGVIEGGDAETTQDGSEVPDGPEVASAPDVEPPSSSVLPSARAAGAGEDLTKALFRKLAEASHPDKAADEADRVRRTEIMKRLTVAYRAGDLATLVELERALETGASISAATPDDEHAALVRVNAALRKQVRALDRELREARGRKGALDATSEAARESIEQYRKVHAFVMRFRDGKMSLAEFLRGPELQDDDPHEADVLVEVFELLDELARSAPPPRRPSRRRR